MAVSWLEFQPSHYLAGFDSQQTDFRQLLGWQQPANLSTEVRRVNQSEKDSPGRRAPAGGAVGGPAGDTSGGSR